MPAVALEAHRAGRGARSPEHGLRALDDDEVVVGLRRDVGHRVVHARRAGAGHRAVVGHQVQARAEHAAKHRIAVGAAIADGGEAGNGLEVVGAVAGRNRLARELGTGLELEGRHRRQRGDEDRVEVDRLAGRCVGGGIGQGDGGGERQHEGLGDGQGQARRTLRRIARNMHVVAPWNTGVRGGARAWMPYSGHGRAAGSQAPRMAPRQPWLGCMNPHAGVARTGGEYAAGRRRWQHRGQQRAVGTVVVRGSGRL